MSNPSHQSAARGAGTFDQSVFWATYLAICAFMAAWLTLLWAITT